jgi:hypothetical protein
MGAPPDLRRDSSQIRLGQQHTEARAIVRPWAAFCSPTARVASGVGVALRTYPWGSILLVLFFVVRTAWEFFALRFMLECGVYLDLHRKFTEVRTMFGVASHRVEVTRGNKSFECAGTACRAKRCTSRWTSTPLR